MPKISETAERALARYEAATGRKLSPPAAKRYLRAMRSNLVAMRKVKQLLNASR